MGLDMYAYWMDKKLVGDQQTDVQLDVLVDKKVVASLRELQDLNVRKNLKDLGLFNQDFYYWRKFNALHGWMQELYLKKGGTDPDFNTNSVRLEAADIDQLEKDVDDEKLEPVNGFFFGPLDIDEEDMQHLKRFIKDTRKVLAEGKAVFYDSWW